VFAVVTAYSFYLFGGVDLTILLIRKICLFLNLIQGPTPLVPTTSRSYFLANIPDPFPCRCVAKLLLFPYSDDLRYHLIDFVKEYAFSPKCYEQS